MPQQCEWDISVEDLKQLRDDGADFVLIDVREQKEFDICELGGELVPLQTLPAEARRARQDSPYRRALPLGRPQRERGEPHAPVRLHQCVERERRHPGLDRSHRFAPHPLLSGPVTDDRWRVPWRP